MTARKTPMELVKAPPPPPAEKKRTFRDHAEEIAWTLRDMNPKVRRTT